MLEISLVIFIDANRRGKGPRRINIWLKMRYSARQSVTSELKFGFCRNFVLT